MYQNINVEAAEIVDVMQREKNTVLGGSIIIINNYFGSQHYCIYNLQAAAQRTLSVLDCLQRRFQTLHNARHNAKTPLSLTTKYSHCI